MERPADTTVYRLVHRAMVTGTEQLAGAVDRAAPEDRGRRLDTLARWADAFGAQVRRHQAEEDEHAFPALVDRVPAAAAILVRLDTDHRDFTRVLGELTPAMAALADPAASFPGAQRVAAVTTGRLRDLVAAHVFDEDVNVAPLIERHLSFDEYAAQQAAAISRLPLRVAAGFTVPWLLAASSPAERVHVLGLLPTRLAVASRAGAYRYRRRVAVAFGSG